MLDALGHRLTRQGLDALPRALRRFQRRMAWEIAGSSRVDVERSIAGTAGVVLF